jgi:metal-responsive CopG/Arc/MetJ family transcriptional regulator
VSSGVIVRLPADVAAKVDRVARDELRSRSNAAVRLIDQALRDRQPETKEQQ